MSDIARFQSDMLELLNGLGADKLKTISKRVSDYLQKSNQERIKSQRTVEGGAFAPRKRLAQPNAYQQSRQNKLLLGGLASAARLQANHSKDRIEVGYSGRAAQLARWHNEGVTQRLPSGQSIVVPSRHYFGISTADINAIETIIAEEL